MSFDTLTILVVAILFLSGLLQSTFGFANALTAMPLLSMVIGIRQATPLVALLSTSTAAFVLVYDWRNLQLGHAKKLIWYSIAGIPVGLLWLQQVDETIVKAGLAILVISFAVFCLWSPDRQLLKSDRSAWFFGFCGGMLGGAYNTYGPPIVVYGTLRKWDSDHFRANLQAFFLPTGLCILGGHAATGLWTNDIFYYYAVALPGAILAVWIGAVLKRQFSPKQFIRVVYLLLFAVGASLLWFCIRSV